MPKKFKPADYNKFSSYIFRELTTIGPPDIPNKYFNQARFMFSDIIKAREQIPNLGKNISSYPYFVYKIFDKILPPNDMENRRIFYFIHLPSKATIAKKENEWNAICAALGKPVQC